MFLVFLLYLEVAPEQIEDIGDTLIIRHEGMFLSHAYDLEAYLLPILVMVLSVLSYWKSFKRINGFPNES
jgi:hypothetical protein